MKKIASLLLGAMLILSLCACGCERSDSQTTPTTAPTTDTILPDPTLDSLLPDSGLLDTSEPGGTTGDGMRKR